MIGLLIYLIIGTRPDITYVLIQMACQTANLSQEHLDKALYICRYLFGTREYSLVYDGEGDKELIACTDSDWSQDKITGYSQTGFYLKLVNGVLLCNSYISNPQILIKDPSQTPLGLLMRE